jgi:hypothetical protein
MESKWREKLTRVGSHTYQKLSQCQGERFDPLACKFVVSRAG